MEEKFYKRIGFWIKLIICIICIPILFMNSVIIADSYLHPSEIPSFFGYKPFIVLSSSMEVEISAGDLAIVKETDINSLKVDDVITFKDTDDTVVTHRIVGIQNENDNISFVTKGDNNNTEDQNLVNANAVEGKYLFKLTGLGNVAMYLQSPFGFITVLLIFFIIFLIYIFVMNLRVSEEHENEKEQLYAEIEKLQGEEEKKKNKNGV